MKYKYKVFKDKTFDDNCFKTQLNNAHGRLNLLVEKFRQC